MDSLLKSVNKINNQKAFDDLVNFNPFKRIHLPKPKEEEKDYEEIVHHIMSVV